MLTNDAHALLSLSLSCAHALSRSFSRTYLPKTDAHALFSLLLSLALSLFLSFARSPLLALSFSSLSLARSFSLSLSFSLFFSRSITPFLFLTQQTDRITHTARALSPSGV